MAELKKHPYYICAPDYTDSSAGISVLHKLCDSLNRKGFEAYIVYAEKTKPGLQTPLLTERIARKHKKENLNPIAVYSDIYSGNPLRAPVAVRYMLNKEGVIRGNRVNADPDDLFFYYSEAFTDNNDSKIIRVPILDLDLFKEEPRITKDLKLLYINRIPEKAIDFSKLPSDIEILSNRNPLSLEQLAEKLKKTSVLYSYEGSGTLTLAMLCGCPVVIGNLEGYEKLGFNNQNLSLYRGYGYCFNDSKEELEKARLTTKNIRGIWKDIAKNYVKQLDVFISETQDKASCFVSKPSTQIDEWLQSRKVTNKQAKRIASYFVGSERGSFISIVRRCGRDESISFKKGIEVGKNERYDLSAVLHSANGMMVNDKIYNVIAIPDSLESINDALSQLKSDWILVTSSADKVLESGLLMAQVELSQQPNLAAISFDEVYRQEDDSLVAAFKPANNLDYLLSFPAAYSRHWLFNRKALLEIGGFDTSLPNAFELDAILRTVSRHGLDRLAHIPEPIVVTQPPVLANVDDERITIEQHLHERGYENAVVHAPNPGRYQIRYNHPGQPVVSMLIAAGKDLIRLQRCVDGLLASTAYQTFEILFIQQPDSSVEVKQWLVELAAMQEPKLRVVVSSVKSLAAQYNQAQEQAVGDYLLFLSADVAVVEEHWLEEMLNHAQRNEVGVVGGKLLTADGEIAHAGHILGLHGPVGSPFVGEAMDAPGYMQRLQVDQNLSAVGGDCMMVYRRLFAELGGFDTGGLADSYLSVDFCLRSRDAGFLTVWTPQAQLMLERDVLPVPDSKAEDLMYDKWLPQLAHDPAYNPNLSLSMPNGYMLADAQISWRPLDSIRSEPVALVHPADLFGCGHYRIMQPFLAMKEAGIMDGAISTGLMHVTDLERYNPDAIILQRQIGVERLEAMRRMQRFSRAIKVYELDDYLPNLPLKSVHRKDMPKDILKSLRRGLSYVDRFVVSTHALAEAVSGLHGEIVVCENRLPTSWWSDLKTQRKQGKKPRVGWAGGSSHTGDLELIADVVRDLADEVEWVFFGMCPAALKPYVHEIHEGVPIDHYPAKLASLNLDLGIAPLEHNLFNECKSNLRQLEYGACGIPAICTDIRPYQEGQQAGLPVTLVKNRYKDWMEAIRMHINDLSSTARIGDELRAKVLAEWMLKGQYLQDWRDAWLGK